MYPHPNGVGHNSFEQFPEIFKDGGVDFAHFLTALGAIGGPDRPIDFFLSGQFLYASQETRDINMLFSAVQRLYGYKHKDFPSYIKGRRVRNRLLGITDDTTLRRELESIEDEYNEKYGMRRMIHRFYTEHLSDDSKLTLNGKIAVPTYFYATVASDADDGVKQMLDFLLTIRNGHDHAAMYHPLSPTGEQPEYIHVVKGGKEYTFLVYLTFAELHEITRKAMADFWLKEYEKLLTNGGKARVDRIRRKQELELQRLNEQRK